MYWRPRFVRLEARHAELKKNVPQVAIFFFSYKIIETILFFNFEYMV